MESRTKPETKRDRKPYQPPVLVAYGNIVRVTMAASGTPSSDASTFAS